MQEAMAVQALKGRGHMRRHNPRLRRRANAMANLKEIAQVTAPMLQHQANIAWVRWDPHVHVQQRRDVRVTPAPLQGERLRKGVSQVVRPWPQGLHHHRPVVLDRRSRVAPSERALAQLPAHTVGVFARLQLLAAVAEQEHGAGLTNGRGRLAGRSLPACSSRGRFGRSLSGHGLSRSLSGRGPSGRGLDGPSRGGRSGQSLSARGRGRSFGRRRRGENAQEADVGFGGRRRARRGHLD